MGPVAGTAVRRPWRETLTALESGHMTTPRSTRPCPTARLRFRPRSATASNSRPRLMAIANASAYKDLTPPTTGDAITMRDGKLEVPNEPIIPFIEGDGIGPDIWRASRHVFDAAVA